jgi:hypothetical protein
VPFYLLSLHPWVEAKLHEELATVLNGRTPQYEDIADLRYTRMVIEESMRLYPPAHTNASLFHPITYLVIVFQRMLSSSLLLSGSLAYATSRRKIVLQPAESGCSTERESVGMNFRIQELNCERAVTYRIALSD